MSTPVAAPGATVERPADSLRALSCPIHTEPQLVSYEHRSPAEVADLMVSGRSEVGRDIIAAASAGAALVMSEVAEARDVTIKLSGTPAEDSGGGTCCRSSEEYSTT